MLNRIIRAEYFGIPSVPTMTAESERANALRCAQEDVDAARLEYVLRRSHIGRANKGAGMFAKAEKSMAFIMFNKARAALNRAEKKMRLLGD